MKAIGIIPARYASSRFPGKPLALIGGKSMINRVVEQASKCQTLQKIVVATDDERIFEHVTSFGCDVVMTSAAHISGTSRISEAVSIISEKYPSLAPEIIVNIQGDEPFIDPGQINSVIGLFENQAVQIATLIKKIEIPEDIFNPNVVKVVAAESGKVLYFSRSAIPFLRGVDPGNWFSTQTFFKHIGLYAYSTALLPTLVNLPPVPAETAESLEQLRWISHGYDIYTALTDIETVGIDTPADLLKVTNNF